MTEEAEMMVMMERMLKDAEGIKPDLLKSDGSSAGRFVLGAREYFEVGEWMLAHDELKLLADANPAFAERHRATFNALTDYFSVVD